MASPRTRRVLKDLKVSDENNVSVVNKLRLVLIQHLISIEVNRVMILYKISLFFLKILTIKTTHSK